jgi:hypothetical protein
MATPPNGLPPPNGIAWWVGNWLFGPLETPHADPPPPLLEQLEDLPANVTQRMEAAVAGRAVQMGERTALAEAHPFHDRVYRLMKDLRFKVAERKAVEPAQRKEIRDDLLTYIDNVAGLKNEDRGHLRSLSELLSQETPLTLAHLEIIERAFLPIEKIWQSRTGFVGRLIHILKEDDKAKSVVQGSGQAFNQVLGEALIALNNKIVGMPHPLIEGAYNAVKELMEAAAANAEMKPEKRAGASQCLQNFLAAELLPNEKQAPIRALRELLASNEPWNAARLPAIQTALALLENLWQERTGLIGRTIESAKERGRQVLGSAGSQGVKAESVRVQEEVKRAMLARVGAKSGPSEKQPENRTEALLHQFQLLKINAAKMVLGQIILQSVCKITPAKPPSKKISRKQMKAPPETPAKNSPINGDPIKQLIADTMPQHNNRGSHDLFKENLFRYIDNAPIHGMRKILARGCYYLLEPVVSYYINNFVRNLTEDLEDWITQDSSQRLETLLKVIITPATNYLTTVSDGYEKIKAPTTAPVQKSPDQMLAKYINDLKVGGLTDKKLLGKLTSHILSYLPRLNWAHKASARFEKRSEKMKAASPALSQWLYFCSQFLFGLGKIISPFQWLVNKTIQLSLKQILDAVVFRLWDSTKADLGGEYNLHALNVFLRSKLQELKADLENPAKASETENRGLSMPMQDSVWQMILNMVEVLMKQKAAITLDNLRDSHLFMNVVKAILFALLLPPIQSAATKKIAPIFQKVVSQDAVEELLLLILKTMQKEAFLPNTERPPTPAEKIADEENMRTELTAIARKILQKTLDEQFNPKFHIQAELDIFLAEFKKDIATIHRAVAGLSSQTLKKLIADWNNIQLFMDARIEQFQARTTDSATLEIVKIVRTFCQISVPVADSISTLNAILIKLERAEESRTLLLNLLAELKDPYPYKKLVRTFLAINLDKFPPNMREALAEFKAIIQEYSSSSEKDRRGLLEQHKIPTLNRLIASTQWAVEAEILSHQMALQGKLEELKKAMPDLARWAAELPPITTHEETVTIAAFIGKTAGPQTVPVLSEMILSSSDQVLKFINKKHHIRALILYFIDAFLETRSQSA